GPAGLDFDRHGRLFIAEVFAGRIVEADLDTAAVTVFKDGLTGPAGLNFRQEFVLPGDVGVQPRSGPEPVNPNARGVVPVALLGTDAFDVTTVNSSSVRFGVNGVEAAPAQSHLEDVDGDGRLDIVFQFPTTKLGIPAALPAGSVVTLKLTGQ